jgi:hypothetical protein
MHEYTVLDVAHTGAGNALCLADATGGHHVARATAAVPAVGDRLLGNRPALGFGLLTGTSLDQVFRVIFEAVHCSREQALNSLHGTLNS